MTISGAAIAESPCFDRDAPLIGDDFDLLLHLEGDSVDCDDIEWVAHCEDDSVIFKAYDDEAEAFGEALGQRSGEFHVDLWGRQVPVFGSRIGESAASGDCGRGGG